MLNQPMNFEILGPAGPRIPLVVHVPHSATNIPPDVRETLCLDEHVLQRELLCLTDWYTDRLFSPVLDLGGTLFVNRLSRLVFDPERFPDDRQEVMAAKGMGAVYTRTSDGRALRKPMSREQRTSLMEVYFNPYATAFADLVSQVLDRHGRCLILDGHSFPSVPLPCELDQQPDRPGICLGTDEFHTPESLISGIRNICEAHGLYADLDRPFSGTYVPLQYWRADARVNSVMIEIRRDLYMDEWTGKEMAGLDHIRKLVLKIGQTMRNR